MSNVQDLYPPVTSSGIPVHIESNEETSSSVSTYSFDTNVQSTSDTFKADMLHADILEQIQKQIFDIQIENSECTTTNELLMQSMIQTQKQMADIHKTLTQLQQENKALKAATSSTVPLPNTTASQPMSSSKANTNHPPPLSVPVANAQPQLP